MVPQERPLTQVSKIPSIFVVVNEFKFFSGAHVSHPPTTDPVTQNEGLSYWEKEFQANTQKLYQTFEIFFVDFVVPTYHMVKESALLTTAVLLFFILYFTKAISGLFKGEGTTVSIFT